MTEGFLQAVRGVQQEAWSRATAPSAAVLAIAGRHIKFCFAEAVMASRILPAFSHLIVESWDQPIDLTVYFWDQAHTGVAMVPRPWQSRDLLPRGGVRGFGTAEIDFAYDQSWHGLSILDNPGATGYFWMHDADNLPQWERASPARFLLNAWLRRRDAVLAHAAVIGNDRSGLLLPARGMSGKSTTSLLAMADGFRYISDDYCVLDLAAQPVAHCLFNTAKLRAESLSLFPELVQLIAGCREIEGERPAVYFDRPEHNLILSLPVRAVLVPEIGLEDETRITALRAGAALRALAPSSVFQLAGAGPVEFALFTRLLRGVPCFRLTLGRRPERILTTLRGVLREFDA